MARGKATSAFVSLLAVLILLIPVPAHAELTSTANSQLRIIRVLHPEDTLHALPGCLPLLPGGEACLMSDSTTGGAKLVIAVTVDGRTDRIAYPASTPLGLTIDPSGSRAFLFEGDAVTEVPLSRGEASTHRIGSLDLPTVEGMTWDPTTERLMLLDSDSMRIARLDPAAGLSLIAPESDDGSVWLSIDAAVPDRVRGAAADPSTGRVHLFLPPSHLIEIDSAGLPSGVRLLPGPGIGEPLAMLFAPSSDATDASDLMHLFIADGATGAVVEYSLAEAPPQPQALTVVSALVRTIDTSAWSPPSPDPAGIAWLPATGTLLVSDSEVNEMSIFTGDNLYEMTLQGSLIGTDTTLPYSDEPTGLDYDHATRTLYVSDDTGPRVVHVVKFGPDGIYGTSDDVITSFSTSAFGSTDPEGVAFGGGALWIADGVNSEVYRVSPGANGRFDGVPPAGDDTVTSFDTAVHGVTDPEGIAWNAANGHLYVIGKPSGRLIEVTTSGALVQVIDVSAADASHPAGLAIAPGSNAPSARNIYIVARGVDNDSDPRENDGKAYEMTLPSSSCGSNADCNDGLFCNGVETCASAVCQGGTDPCPGQACDESTDTCSPCDNDGVCEVDENCDNCPADCIGADAGCGNGFCEPGLGEDCLSCPQDCAGKQNGRVDRRFCCGDGAGQGAVGCSDPRCSGSGFACSVVTLDAYCCGDAVCGGAEDAFNCSLDCGAPPTCGDGTCSAARGESPCTCSADCGTPPSIEGACSNGEDDDCDGLVDGVDPDCCTRGRSGDACSGDGDCCSGHCKGKRGAKTCR